MDDELAHSVFASDLAQDVRSEFNTRRADGMSVAEATSAIVSVFRHLLERPAEGPIVIVAIAALQLREQALSSTFRAAALDLLQEGHGFENRSGEMRAAREQRDDLRNALIGELTDANVVAED